MFYIRFDFANLKQLKVLLSVLLLVVILDVFSILKKPLLPWILIFSLKNYATCGLSCIPKDLIENPEWNFDHDTINVDVLINETALFDVGIRWLSM